MTAQPRRSTDLKRPIVHDAAELDAALAPASAPGLLQLHLEGPEVTEKMVADLARRRDLVALKTVTLTWSTIGDAALAHLAEGPLIRPLRLLVLDIAGATSVGLARLAKAPFPLALTTLALFNREVGPGRPNQVDDDALRALASGSALRAVESLDLSYNPCTAEGIRALANSSSLPALREVTAWRTGLTQEGVNGLGTLRFRLASDFDYRIIDYSSE